MVDISSGDKKINITVSTSGNKASVNATPDMAMYYSNKSREWAISNKIVDNEDYSSKYYANVSKKQAETVEDKITEVNNAVEEGITNIINQENISVDNVNTAGATQVNLATEQATIATEQAAIATAKTSEVVESGDNAITAITEQETTSKNNIETKGAEQIELIQNEGAIQIANVQSTGFYMRDDKLYFINSQGEETEFKSGGSGLEVCDIGMALYVDETKGLRRYLNGQIVDINANTQAFLDRLKQITTLHPSLLCTEQEWQTAKTRSAFGQVGKFVFNYSGDEVISVRIPRVVNVQGLFDLSKLGMTVGAGLPNITGNFALGTGDDASTGSDYSATSVSGCFTKTQLSDGKTVASTTNSYDRCRVDFNASKSSSIYGNSDTVQQEAIQYPYFIQIATGQETEANITNIIEVNNPYTFGMFQYTDVELNNLSWLKSTNVFQSKSVYPSLYNWVLAQYNQEKEGFKGINDEYSNADWVINTTDETFRTPIIASVNNALDKRFLVDKKEATDVDSTWYNWYSDGYIEQGGIINVSVGSDKYPVCTLLKPYRDTTYVISNNILQTAATQNWGAGSMSVYTSGKTVTQFQFVSDGVTNCVGYHWKTVGYGEIPTVEDIADNFNLYFYAGETVQNANLIDAGRIGEQLATKEDIDTWVYCQNGTSGYRYNRRNGYCEQWGKASLPPSGTIVNLLKTYKNKDYNLVGIFGGTTARGNMGVAEINTENSFKIYHEAGLNEGFCLRWKTSGYLAQGQY